MILKHVFMRFCLICIFSITSISKPALSAPYCAALQGNGDGIFGHFHSLARMVEEFGPVDALAGSSSATITMFLYESMFINPAITAVNQDSKEQALRLSLFLKSLVGFYQHNLPNNESIALQNFSNIQELLEPDNIESVESHIVNLIEVLGILYNPRFGELLWQSPNLNYHLKDLYESYSKGPWNMDSPKIFLRPFPIDFNGVATIVGWIGNFYAARGYNQDSWDTWIKSCGPLERFKDKSWGEIAYLNYSPENKKNFTNTNSEANELTTCGKGFQSLLADYDKNSNKNDKRITSRIDEPVGKYLRTLPITGLLVESGAIKMEEAMRQHWAAIKNIDLAIDFEKEFKVGFFGRTSDLNTISSSVQYNLMNGSLNNIKAEKFTALPGYTWRMAMRTSPAEPTIAEAKIIIPHKLVSVGGWVDPQPATLLKHAGCKNIIFITGELESTDFLDSLNNLIGGKSYNERLTSHKPIEGFGPSAMMEGLLDANAVWCTDWHHHRGTDLKSVYDMSEISYRAPFEVRSAFFETNHYLWDPLLKRPGCTPGI